MDFVWSLSQEEYEDMFYDGHQVCESLAKSFFWSLTQEEYVDALQAWSPNLLDAIHYERGCVEEYEPDNFDFQNTKFCSGYRQKKKSKKEMKEDAAIKWQKCKKQRRHQQKKIRESKNLVQFADHLDEENDHHWFHVMNKIANAEDDANWRCAQFCWSCYSHFCDVSFVTIHSRFHAEDHFRFLVPMGEIIL